MNLRHTHTSLLSHTQIHISLVKLPPQAGNTHTTPTKLSLSHTPTIPTTHTTTSLTYKLLLNTTPHKTPFKLLSKAISKARPYSTREAVAIATHKPHNNKPQGKQEYSHLPPRIHTQNTTKTKQTHTTYKLTSKIVLSPLPAPSCSQTPATCKLTPHQKTHKTNTTLPSHP